MDRSVVPAGPVVVPSTSNSWPGTNSVHVLTSTGTAAGPFVVKVVISASYVQIAAKSLNQHGN